MDRFGMKIKHDGIGVEPTARIVDARSFFESPASAVPVNGGGVRCRECCAARERDELLLRFLGVHAAADKRLSGLTRRQHEVMKMVLAGHPSKNIAADLRISRRTVENHRASIMKRTGVRSLPELARLAIAADWANPVIAASGKTAD